MNEQNLPPEDQQGIAAEDQGESKQFFFLASVLAIYERDGENKQRNLNVLLQSNSMHLTKSDLNTLHRTALQRINMENKVTPDMVKDIVFMSINLLGLMTSEEFQREEETAAA